MKFGKTIRDKAIPEWAMHYMDYKALKKVIRKCMSYRLVALHDSQQHSALSESVDMAPTDPDGVDPRKENLTPEEQFQTAITYFFFLLQRQLEKVSELFSQEVTLARSRMEAISDKLNQMGIDEPLNENDFRRQTVLQLLRGINGILKHQYNLREFSHMNMEGFRKILKKFDKKMNTKYAAGYMSERVGVAPFANCADVLDPITSRAKALKQKIDRALGGLAAAGLHTRRESIGDLISDPVWDSNVSEKESHDDLDTLLETNQFKELDKAMRQLSPLHRPAFIDDLLVRACRTANSAGIRYCLGHQSNTLHHTEPHGYTSWHILVRHNNASQLEELCRAVPKRILRKAFLECDVQGQTVVHLAAALNRVSMLQTLKQFGADMDTIASNGYTPLLVAIARNQEDAIFALIDMGVDCDLFSPDLSTCLSPLSLAAQRGNTRVVDALLRAGADDMIRDSEGEIALHKACAGGHLDSLRLLVRHNPKASQTRDDFELHTPLFLCAKHCHEECARVLLEHGASANVRDIKGWTPSTYAMYFGHIIFAEELIQHGQGKPFSKTPSENHNQQGTSLVKGNTKASLNIGQTNRAHPPALEDIPQKLLVDPRQPLDVTSFIDKEGTYRVRGSEKSVPFAQRTYGHEYLDDTARAFVDVRPMKFADLIRLVDVDGLTLGIRQCMLQCAIIFQDNSEDMAQPAETSQFRSITMPINEDGDSFVFDVPVDAVHAYASIEFRLASVFDTNTILACGRLPLRRWQQTSEEHTTHQVTLIDRNLSSICVLHCNYLLVLPYQGAELRIQPGSTYWTTRKQLPVWGHRGTGAAKEANVDGNTYRTHVQENTVLSFVTAANLGADYVEFDVQITRDQVPVIYHNWTLGEVLGFDIPVDLVTLDAFLSIRERRMDDTTHLGDDIGQHLSLRENSTVNGTFHRAASNSPENMSFGFTSQPSHAPTMKHRPCFNANLERRNRPRAYSNPEVSKSKTQCLPVDPHRYVRAPLATLAEALTLVPESLGFNIEIKYPLLEHQKIHKLQSWEMNTFADTTLDVIFKHAGNRKIVFSCFHPDMCRILSLKQPCYPVLFLTCAGHKDVFMDQRAMSLRAAVRFAASTNLLGIVSNARPLVLCPELIHEVKSAGLLLLTWGKENNDVDCVRLQEACGVDAVIVDHIAHIRKGLRPRVESPSDDT